MLTHYIINVEACTHYLLIITHDKEANYVLRITLDEELKHVHLAHTTQYT
jgi:hypothetical protein